MLERTVATLPASLVSEVNYKCVSISIPFPLPCYLVTLSMPDETQQSHQYPGLLRSFMARSSHEYDIVLLGRNYVFFFSYFSFFVEGFHYLKTTSFPLTGSPRACLLGIVLFSPSDRQLQLMNK